MDRWTACDGGGRDGTLNAVAIVWFDFFSAGSLLFLLLLTVVLLQFLSPVVGGSCEDVDAGDDFDSIDVLVLFVSSSSSLVD